MAHRGKPQNRLQLDHECEELCLTLGFGVPSDRVKNSYASAHKVIFGQERQNGRPGISEQLAAKAIRCGRDVEALEYALRRYDRYNALTKKVHLLAYLLEATPSYYEVFHSRRTARFCGYFLLIFYAFRSIYKMLKGKFLLRQLRSSLANNQRDI